MNRARWLFLALALRVATPAPASLGGGWEAAQVDLAGLPAPNSPERRAELVRRAVAPGPQPAGWPAGARVSEVIERDGALVVRLELPRGFLLGGGVTDEWLEGASRSLLAALGGEPVSALHLSARDPRDRDGRWTALSAFLPRVDRAALVKERVAEPGDDRAPAALPAVTRVRGGDTGDAPVVSGPLSGKTVYLSQCHGWIDYNTADAWETQRGITNGIVEDFVNPEAANEWLIRYLENAGATVWTLRESDRNPNMVVVDSRDGVATPANGTYVETGSAGLFSNSGLSSFGNFRAPYSSSDDPLRVATNSDRLITTAATETARATWTPNLPAAGYYTVYLTYTRNGAARARDAHYIVSHAGGQSHFRVNQELHGWVWIRLGRFYFNAGSAGSVALANDSVEAGATVSADAVRFGGGMGDIEGEYHPVVSGHPRWEEGARYFTQYMGGTSSVWSAGDVASRSKFAAWENYAGIEDSLYLSWHSNAFDGTARGTNTYIYSANPPDGTYDPGQSAPGSPELATAVHAEMVNDIRAGWDAAWQDRGKKSAYFGEINPAYNNEMPSVLLEVAFHDNATDAQALSDPRFRRLLARSIYQGIVKYFAARDGQPVRLLPEPPREPEVHSTGRTSLQLSWLAPLTDANGLAGDAATGYRIYHSTDGRGFDDGVAVTGTSATLSGYAPGSLHYFRVTATNAGGESLPTETLAVRLPYALEPKVLLVGGFDRLDRSQLVPRNEPDLGGSVNRMELERMNDFSYPLQHAPALANAGVAFDYGANEAVASGRVALAPATHAALDWISGEESTLDETFSATEQNRVQTYLSAGGRIFASGAELGWDLDNLGSAADRSFYQSALGSDYVSDDAGTYSAAGVAGSIFSGVSGIGFDDGTGPTYGVEYPDVVAPISPGLVCLNYSTGSGAAIQRDAGAWRSVALGFPFETITNATLRGTVMKKAMDWLIPCTAPSAAPALSGAAKSGGTVALTLLDPNPPASLTGYDLLRSPSPSAPLAGWSALITNGADDQAAAGVQLSDSTAAAPPASIWFYQVRARNERCGFVGP